MHEASNPTLGSAWKQTRGIEYPTEVILQATNAALCAAALYAVGRDFRAASSYLMLHGFIACASYMLARLDQLGQLTGRRLWLVSLLRDYAPPLVIIAFFFEIGALIPTLRACEARCYDKALLDIDLALFGDVDAGVIHIGTRWLSDVLMVCYVAYYPLIAIVPVVLYLQGRIDDFRRAEAIIMMGFVLTYLGYFLVPAVGPYLVIAGPRAAVLDGFGFAANAHSLLSAVPREPPDAFPSGHALMGIIGPALAWRFYRPLFAWMAPIGVGIVLATVYLRYHYIIDVVASFVVAPTAWALGESIHRYVVRVSALDRKSIPA